MGLTIICPECGAGTPYRTIHDEPGQSVVWACRSRSFAWNAVPLSRPPGELVEHGDLVESTNPSQAA